MGTITFRETNTIRQIEKSYWESIPPRGEFHLSYAFSEMMEAANMPGVHFYYLIVSNENQPIYKLALMTFEVKFFRFFPRRLKAWLLKIGFPVDLFGKFNILTIQSLFYLITSPVLDESLMGEAKTAIIQKIRQIGRKSRSQIFLLYQKSVMGFARLFKTIQGPPSAWLDMKADWKSFEDYVTNMRHKHRWNLKQKQQACLKANVTSAVRACRDVDPAEARKLFLNVLAKYSNEVEQFNLMTADYFQAIRRLPADDLLYITASQNQDFIGYIAGTLDSKRTLYLEFLGMDYKAVTAPVYFELLYRAIDYSIKNNISRIDFGVDFLEAKMNLGAKAVSKNMQIMPLTRLSRHIVNCMAISPVLKEIFTLDNSVLSKNVFR